MFDRQQVKREGQIGTTFGVGWIASISPSRLIALAALLMTLLLAQQTLEGRSTYYSEGVYWQSLRAMAHGYSLYDPVFSSQPPLFLLSVYPFYIIWGESLGAARLAIVFFSLVGVTGIYVAGRALGHRIIGAMACLLLSLDLLYQESARTLSAELPSIALQTWAVACAALAMRATGRRRGLLAAGAGVLLGCALLTKLFAIVALVPIVLYLSAPSCGRWFNDEGKRRQPQRRLRSALGLLTTGLFGVIILVLLPFVAQLGTVYDQAVRFHLAAADRHPVLENFLLIAGMLRPAPTIYIAMLALLAIAWRRMWVSLPLIFWALAALVILVQQYPLFGPHVVLLTPSLALIGGCGAFAVWQLFTAPTKQRAGLPITLILLVLASANLAINLHRNAWAKEPPPARQLDMATALQSVSAPGEIVLSDDQYVAALANRDVPPQLVDTSVVRIISGYLTEAELKSLIIDNHTRAILFASGRFDLFPGFRKWVAQRYTQVATFHNDGALFLLKPNTRWNF